MSPQRRTAHCASLAVHSRRTETRRPAGQIERMGIMSETNGKPPTTPPKTVKVAPPAQPMAAELVDTKAVELPDNEIEAQIAAAHRHPRSIKKFMLEAKEMVTLSEDIAESCLYRLKRWDAKLQKEVPLIGGSVRLAEICLSLWGNVHAGARPVEETVRYVRAQGVCW